VDFCSHISDIIGSDRTGQMWQYSHSAASSVVTLPPDRQMKGPARVQPAFWGCEVSRCKAHYRYRSGEANQLLHPALDTCAQCSFIPSKEHLCVHCSPPHSYLLRSDRILVKLRGIHTEFNFLSLSCLCSALLFTPI